MPCDPGFHCQAKEIYTEDRGANPTPPSQRDAEHLSLPPGAGWIPSVPLQRVGGPCQEEGPAWVAVHALLAAGIHPVRPHISISHRLFFLD